MEGLGGLDPPSQSIAASWPHSYPYSVLCCVISRKYKKDVCLGKVLPTSSWPLLQPLLFFAMPCYYQQSLTGSAARGYRHAVQVQGQLLSWGPTWCRQMECDAGAPECPVQSPEPPPEEGQLQVIACIANTQTTACPMPASCPPSKWPL